MYRRSKITWREFNTIAEAKRFRVLEDLPLDEPFSPKRLVKIGCHCGNPWSPMANNVIWSKLRACPDCRPRRKSKYAWADLRKELQLRGMDTVQPNGIFPTIRGRVDVRCFCGRVFSPCLTNILYKSGGTRSCGCVKSHQENEVADFIERLGVKTIRRSRTLISPAEIDIWLPDHKLAVEFNGLHWHSEGVLGPRAKTATIEKRNSLALLGIGLAMIFEDEWTHARTQTKKRLQQALGLLESPAPSEKTVWADNRWPHEALTLQDAGFIERGCREPQPHYFVYGRDARRIREPPTDTKKWGVVWDLGATCWLRSNST